MKLHPSLRFTLLALTIAFAADRAVSWVLDRAYQADLNGQTGGQINRYLQRAKVPDVLVIGSSRAHHGVDPAVIAPNGYNLSHNGMNIAFQAGLVDLLDQHDRTPTRLLLVQVQPEDLIGGDAVLRHLQYLKYHHGRSAFITSAIDGLSWSERLKYLAAGHRFNGSALTIPINALRPRTTGPGNGFEPSPSQANDTARVALSFDLQRTTDSTLFAHVPEDPMASAGGRCLLHIREVCAARGVQLVLFTAPYHACTAIRREAYARIGDAFRAHGFEWLDYSCAPPAELRHLHYWVDNDHVNAEGARKLSMRLAFDLRRLGFLNWHPTPP